MPTVAVLTVLVCCLAGQVQAASWNLSGDLVADTGDTIKVALVPQDAVLDPGDTLRVDIVITEAGPAFNAFDAYVTYDKSRLTFLQAANLMDQEGSLMRNACPVSFHQFSVAPDSSYVGVNYSLMCPGVSVTGPGVIYRLSFLCGPHDADTVLRFRTDPPPVTRFFFDGTLVQPLAAQKAYVRIGEGSSPVPPPALGTALRAAPNPFNPRTRLSFELEKPGQGTLAVYEPTGRRVRTIRQGLFVAGVHTYNWDGRTDHGRSLAAGCYLVRLHLDGRRSLTTPVTLLK